MRQIRGLACLLGVLTLTLWAKDFWEEKPFNSWTEKEALRILSDSPWGKIQQVNLVSSEWDGGQVNNPVGNIPPRTTPLAGGRVGEAGDVQGDPSSGRNVPGAGVPGGYGETGSANRSVPFQVSWYSSVKVRQAMGRLGQLQSGVWAELVNSFVQQPLGDYIIAVSGP